MRYSSVLAITAIFAAGYLIGQSRYELAQTADAQTIGASLSEDASNEILASNRSLEAAIEELETEGRYVSATTGPNSFLVLTGGGDAVADLEAGDGVDPETFAALYAGRASEEIKPNLTIDDEGRLLYKGAVVRLYSIKRLKQLYDRREELAKESDF